jgi:hypothetical protein
MDLFQNPFHILSVTPRDNKQRIMELADERTLSLDPSECIQARSDLTNPRKRLAAELAWLPGISPKRVNNLLDLLKSDPESLSPMDLPPIAQANVLASCLSHLPGYTSRNVANLIHETACAFEDVDSEQLCTMINEERTLSGFPPVTDVSLVDEELQERRFYFKQVFKSALNELTPRDLVEAVTIAIVSASDYGEEHGPILIDDLIDSYEVEVHVFLEREEENIGTLVEKLQSALDAGHSDSALSPMIDQLIKVVKNWDFVAQPIQVSSKSRGLDHGGSQRVARLVRNLAIHMFNDHDKLNFSRQLTDMLQEVFAEVVEVAELTAEDANALDKIAERRGRMIEDARNRAEKWAREITYEANVGSSSKNKLRISPEGIEWKGHLWNLNSVTRVRWGGIQEKVNAAFSSQSLFSIILFNVPHDWYGMGHKRVDVTTTYFITFGDTSRSETIELENPSGYESVEKINRDIYGNFVDRLWKSVGVRLLTEFLEGLRDGKQYRFESTTLRDLATAVFVTDGGVEVERKKFILSRERFFCSWNELTACNAEGFFCIGKKEDKKAVAAFSYLDEDNIHILEAAIRTLLNRGGDRLSSLMAE